MITVIDIFNHKMIILFAVITIALEYNRCCSFQSFRVSIDPHHFPLMYRNPIPDSYDITLEISRDRTTTAWNVVCDSKNADKTCPTGYSDGDVYLHRTLNEACQKRVSVFSSWHSFLELFYHFALFMFPGHIWSSTAIWCSWCKFMWDVTSAENTLFFQSRFKIWGGGK